MRPADNTCNSNGKRQLDITWLLKCLTQGENMANFDNEKLIIWCRVVFTNAKLMVLKL